MRTDHRLLSTLVVLAWATFAAAQAVAAADGGQPADAGTAQPLPTPTLHAWVDAYYGFNANRPANHESFEPGFGSTAKRAGELGLNVAAVDVSVEPAPVGLHLTLASGESMEVLRAAEPVGTAIGLPVWRLLYQATVAYTAPLGRGLLLQAGIYPSHVGFETFFTKDNWNYTRAWLGEFSPYYQAGVMAAYAFTERLSAQLHLLNGWSIIADNNRAKTVGTQLLWSEEHYSISFNTLIGPELPNDDTHYRFFGDLVAVLRPSSRLSLAAELDLGTQQRPSQDPASWQGVGGWARLQPRPWVAVALRGEFFRDPDAVVAGVGQSVAEGTLTLELRPVEALIFKLEGRYDHSTAPLFSLSDGTTGQDQALVVAGAVAQY